VTSEEERKENERKANERKANERKANERKASAWVGSVVQGYRIVAKQEGPRNRNANEGDATHHSRLVIHVELEYDEVRVERDVVGLGEVSAGRVALYAARV
jgi:hypothetical protein